MNRVTKFAATVTVMVGMGLVAAGCGSTPATSHKPAPKPSASASAKTSKSLTLAEASSASYKVSFPLVNCSTLSAVAQAAWAPLEIGSQINQCAPADFLTKDVPQHITVTDDDPAVSQSKANAYGQDLVDTLTWNEWAAYDDAPAILPALGLSTGDSSGYYQYLTEGDRLVGTMTGNAIYPNSITLVSLNSSDRAIIGLNQGGFALVVTFVQKKYTDTAEYAGQPPKTYTTTTPLPPAIYAGAVATSAALGNYLDANYSSSNCSVSAAVGICEAAGVD